MVFKEVGNELPKLWNPENDGDKLEGTYIKKKINVGPNNSTMYYIEVEGVNRSVWGSTVLDDKMDFVSIGDKIKITYKGKDKEKKYHLYTVEKDFDEESLEDKPVE